MHRAVARVVGMALIGVTLLTSCAAPPPPSTTAPGSGSTSGAPQTPAAPAQRKTLTIGVQEDFANLATPLDIVGARALPTRFMHQFINSYLTARNANNDLVPLLAERLPSLDDGSWKVFDDGRMETT